MVVFTVLSGIAMSAMLQMTRAHGTLWNRTAMRGGARSAVELLQQEISQAGRIAVPGAPKITPAVAVGTQTVAMTSVAGLFVGEELLVDTGPSQEVVTLTTINTTTGAITAVFLKAHAAQTVVSVLGAFASGVVPTTATNGSSGTVLKLYGDLNSDGTMVYVEYRCDTAGGKLYRNVMSFAAAAKPALTSAHVLLDDIQANPGNAPCFVYQQQVLGTDTYVVGVSLTLTTHTRFIDPLTRALEVETRVLLSVTPRNILDVWRMASAGAARRVQPMPASVRSLLL